MRIPLALKIILIIILFFISVFVFFGFFLRVSTRDVSKKNIYKKYLNKPIIVQPTSELMWEKKDASSTEIEYFLYTYKKTLKNEEDRKSIKIYNPGDTIYFNEAKLRRNPSAGNSYYLIGKDTLANGKEITFNYSTNLGSEYKGMGGINHVEIWENVTDYYMRLAEKDSYRSDFYNQPYKINYSLIGSLFQVYRGGDLKALEINTTINPKDKTIEITQKNIVVNGYPIDLNIEEIILADEIYFKLKNIKLLSKEWYESDGNLCFSIKLSYESWSDLEAFDFQLDENGSIKTNNLDIKSHNAISVSDNNYWYYFKKDAPIKFNIKNERGEDQLNALPYWKGIMESH